MPKREMNAAPIWSRRQPVLPVERHGETDAHKCGGATFNQHMIQTVTATTDLDVSEHTERGSAMSFVATQTQSPAAAVDRLCWCTSALTIFDAPRVHIYPYAGVTNAADRRASTAAAATTGYSFGISRAVSVIAARLEC
jgi:hypothetical protein